MDCQDSSVSTGWVLEDVCRAAWARKRSLGPDLGIQLGLDVTQFRKGLGAVGKAVGADPHAAH